MDIVLPLFWYVSIHASVKDATKYGKVADKSTQFQSTHL